MTAKEMFEKLHYREIITEDGNYIYERYGTKYPLDIIFDVEGKFIDILDASFSHHQRCYCCLDNEELNAIEKKRKELGWAKCTCR